jgi:hypothetical protein
VRALLAFIALLANAVPLTSEAHATVINFDISGAFVPADPSPGPFALPPPFPNTIYMALPAGTFSGSLLVDVTTGTVNALDVAIDGFGDHFNIITKSARIFDGWSIQVSDGTGQFGPSVLELRFPTTNTVPDGPFCPFPGICFPSSFSYGTLVGFNGAPSLRGDLKINDFFTAQNNFSGAITIASLGTPAPAALPLFATGLAGLGWLARRRRKHAA